MLKKNTKPFVYVLIVLIPFALFVSRPAFLRPVRLTLMEWASGPIALVSIPVNELKELLTYHQTYTAYRRLKKESDNLKARLVGLEDVIQENNRYGRLLDFKRRLLFSSTAALVIGRDPNNWNSILIINKGATDGIKPGMPVINDLGVVGKVADVGRSVSKVICISDPNFSVAALIQSSRESGLVTGTLQGLCRMRYLVKEAAVKVGDVAVTSKLSSSFPEGLLLGRVTSVQMSPDGSGLECQILPAVAISRVEEVLVIKR